MPESERNTVSNAEPATKIGPYAMTAGLFLAGILAVIILVGSIVYVSDQRSEDARIDQPSSQSLA